jgi:hypothetical protein
MTLGEYIKILRNENRLSHRVFDIIKAQTEVLPEKFLKNRKSKAHGLL